MRTPYGRANWADEGIYWASHGYHMMVQDSRGTSSYFAEVADGADTVKWIEQAPWLGNALLLKGFSYLGFTAWATASTRPASLRALSIQVYSSDRVSSWYPGGSFGLDNALPWTAGQASAVDSSDRSLDLSIPDRMTPASTTSPFRTPTSPSRAPPSRSTVSGCATTGLIRTGRR